MHLMRYIYRNINPLNIILVACASILAIGAFTPYFYAQIKYSLPVAKLPPPEEENPAEAAAVASPSMSDYMVIAEQNLFHPDRKIPLEKKEAQQLPKPELILYGTLVTDGMSVAYVEDKKNPKTSPGRGKRQTVMKKGDAVSGFVLREIENDRIVLARGDETMVVYLNQGDKSRMSEVPPGAAPGGRPAPTPMPVAKPTQPVPVPAKPGAVQPAPAVSPQPSATRNFSPPMPGGGRRPQTKGAGSPVQQPEN
jgi:hypothetical protein